MTIPCVIIVIGIEESESSVETIESVTQWANNTFGEAGMEAQYRKAEQEFLELFRAMYLGDQQKIAEEAADVCICLYRVIGTIDPQAIEKKMAINRARKWNIRADGTAQHA